MIGKLTGKLDSVEGAQALIDVNGVGYVVACSARTLSRIEPVEGPVSLLVETQVREDAISLYGFFDAAERDWFRLLTTVQGVGARVGLAILSALPPEKLSLALASGDKTMLTQADGVGPKLAARLLTELKDKVAHMPVHDKVVTAAHTPLPSPTAAMDEASDAVSALVNLGYRRAEAFAAVAAVRAKTGAAALNDLIRLSLAELSQKDHAA